MTTSLFQEGGVAGHMNHLYDDPALTFGQIKDIFIKAAGGQLLGTEKTDGINLFLSYSVKDGEAKAARNKGNIKSGGLNAEQLASKFADRGSLSDSFKEAFSSWSEAVQKLNPQTQIKIFGPDAEIFYNVEIQDPGSPNVINYDQRNLVIHPTGHAFFDRQTGNISDTDVSENYKLLTNIVNKIQSSDQQTGSFKIINNAVKNLNALQSKEPLKQSLAKLTELQSILKLKDSNSISDYIFARLSNFLKNNVPGLTPSIVKALSDKFLGIKGLNINKILEKVPDAQKEKVKAMANNADSILKELISPLETIIHDYSVEVLKGLQSAFMLDPNNEVRRLRQEVATAIKTIQNSGHEDAIKILNIQLKKLKNAENVFTAAEGFVFTYDGKTYKFTGNFAPVNQILGLFKFGRGNIPPLKDIIKESDKNRIIALLPGGYKPPHVGHYLGAKYFANIPNVDEVRVIISPKSRTDASRRLEVDATKSLKIWQLFVKNDPKIKPMISRVASPVRDVYDTISEIHPGDTLLLGKGEKESEVDHRFDKAQEWANKNNPGVNVKSIATKVEQSLQNISASSLRELIAQNNKNEFLKYMPKHLNNQEKEMIWNILVSKKGGEKNMQEHIVKSGSEYCLKSKKNDKNLGCYSSKGGAENREKQVQYFKHMKEDLQKENCDSIHPEKNHEQWLEEMSSGAGGSAQGFAGPAFVKKQKQYNVNESLFLDRQKLIETNILKNKIRSMIQETFKQKTNNYDSLIKIIRECIITEAKSNVADTVHPSTGINVLEDLLKKIIPFLEQDYKTLTTNKNQRDSYRAHILNAVNKTLTTADINQSAQASDPNNLVQKESLLKAVDEVDVNVGGEPNSGSQDDDKFIDINKKPSDSEEEDTFTIAGKDVTGRNMAQMTFDKIEKNILDSYSVLSDNEDKKLFFDYLMTNLKLYFDKFESEIETDVKEPEVDATAEPSDSQSSGEEIGL